MPIRALSPELAAKARDELNEDPNRLESDLQHIKDWIAKQPHLKIRTDDQWLTAFLRGCKFSLERTKEKLDLFYTLRTTAPDLLSIRPNDPRFNEILETGTILSLPKLAGPDAPRVDMIRPGCYDPNKFRISETIAVNNIISMIRMIEDDNAIVVGIQSILDLDNVTMGHFLQMTPTQMKKMVAYGQDAQPQRLKGTHYLNTPSGFETIFNAVKALLNEKNQTRLYVHNKDYEAMYKHIDKEVLPAEYGGNGGTIQEIIDYWKKKVEEYKPWLEEELQYGTDESKRPGKPKTAEDMFGVEGSFRQLEFD